MEQIDVLSKIKDLNLGSFCPEKITITYYPSTTSINQVLTFKVSTSPDHISLYYFQSGGNRSFSSFQLLVKTSKSLSFEKVLDCPIKPATLQSYHKPDYNWREFQLETKKIPAFNDVTNYPLEYQVITDYVYINHEENDGGKKFVLSLPNLKGLKTIILQSYSELGAITVENTNVTFKTLEELMKKESKTNEIITETNDSIFINAFRHDFKSNEATFILAEIPNKVVAEWELLSSKNTFITKVRIPRSLYSKSKELKGKNESSSKIIRIKPLANNIIVYFNGSINALLYGDMMMNVILEYMKILYNFKKSRNIELVLAFSNIEIGKYICKCLSELDPKLEKYEFLKVEYCISSVGHLFATAKTHYVKSSFAIVNVVVDKKFTQLYLNRDDLTEEESIALKTTNYISNIYYKFAEFLNIPYYQIDEVEKPNLTFIKWLQSEPIIQIVQVEQTKGDNGINLLNLCQNDPYFCDFFYSSPSKKNDLILQSPFLLKKYLIINNEPLIYTESNDDSKKNVDDKPNPNKSNDESLTFKIQSLEQNFAKLVINTEDPHSINLLIHNPDLPVAFNFKNIQQLLFFKTMKDNSKSDMKMAKLDAQMFFNTLGDSPQKSLLLSMDIDQKLKDICSENAIFYSGILEPADPNLLFK